MKPKIYIDGKEGTTGLQIYERLGGRDDIELLLIDEDKRKDIEERRKFLNAADIAFLCLPDAAAREAVSLIENNTTRVIDASTAHRTDPDWDYGFAELSKAHREAIKNSKRVANPGCHASGFISSVYPLVANGIIAEDTALTCASLTGYSGGGKKMIAEYQDENRDPRHDSERIYGLNLHHKHLPEMGYICGLTQAPVFVPIVGDFYKGHGDYRYAPGRRRTPCAWNACQALRGSAACHRGAVRRGRADDLRQHAGRSRQLKAHCLRPRGADDRHRAV